MRTNSVRNTAWILITSENILFSCVRVEREFKLYKSKASSALISTSTELRTTWGSPAPCQGRWYPVRYLRDTNVVLLWSCQGLLEGTALGHSSQLLLLKRGWSFPFPWWCWRPLYSTCWLVLFALPGYFSTFQMCKAQVGSIFMCTVCPS